MEIPKPPQKNKYDKNGLPDFAELYGKAYIVADRPDARFRRFWKFGKVVLLLAALAGAYAHYFYYIDIETGCHFKLQPSYMNFNNLEVKKQLKILKKVSPDNYKTICENVTHINTNFSCGGFGGGCFYGVDQTATDKVITTSASPGETMWGMGILVHETCHALQYRDKRPVSEQECHEASDRLFRAVIVH